jgi:hypothetical protein
MHTPCLLQAQQMVISSHFSKFGLMQLHDRFPLHMLLVWMMHVNESLILPL